MTEAQWMRLAAEIVARWPGSNFGEASVAVYGKELEDLDGPHVAAAIACHDRDGERFPPTAGQIRRKVVELATDAPEWAEVQRVVKRACSYSSRRYCDGEFVDERAAFLSDQHPLLAAFVEQIGWDEAQWAAAGQADDARIAEAQVRTKWERFRGRTERDAAYEGLPSGGLAALERVNREGPRTLTGALDRLLGSGEDGRVG